MTKGIHYVRSCRGGGLPVWYVYAWRGGPQIARIESRSKPGLNHEQISALKHALDQRRTVDPTTFRSLIREWRSEDPARSSSPEWESLARSTKKTWGSALNLIEERWGDTPLSIWSDPRMVAKVVSWRDGRKATPRAADIGVTTLRALLEFGRLRGRVSINVASNIPALYRNGQRAEIIWTEDDIDRFTAAAKRCGREHVLDGLRLAALTGLRREDLVTLTWAEVGDFAITKLALKRSRGKRRRVTMPRIPALNELLNELRGRPRKPEVDTVLVNSHGEAWSADGFGGSFNRIRDEAEVVHIDADTGEPKRKHLHDVRGTFCTQLLTKTDLNDQQVADIMGWSTDRVSTIRKVYVDQSSVVLALSERLKDLGSDSR